MPKHTRSWKHSAIKSSSPSRPTRTNAGKESKMRELSAVQF